MTLLENKRRSLELQSLLGSFIGRYETSVAVVDLDRDVPEIFGYNLDHFIYPASMYNIFIAAEVLHQVELRTLSLGQEVIVKSPNDVDKDARIFSGDARRILVVGDLATIDRLLDLMLTRSDNTASNCLVDLVGRESITQNIIRKYGWVGSEVTRKFLDRAKEDNPYQFSSTTLSCARHLAEFLYLVENGRLVSEFVSERIKGYMSAWNRGTRQGVFLPDYKKCYRKSGFLRTNLYSRGLFSALASIIIRGWAVITWSNDAAVVNLPTGERYVLVVFSITKSVFPWVSFDMEALARTVLDYMLGKVAASGIPDIRILSRDTINAVPIQDCREPLVDIPVTSRLVMRTGDGAKWLIPRLRKPVVERLLKASESLPEGYKLMVMSAYISVDLQQKVWDRKLEKIRVRHPEWSDSKVLAEVPKYAARPVAGAPHNTGGSVDVVIVDKEGIPLDMGSDFGGVGKLNHTRCSDINGFQLKNRELLYFCMTNAGFFNTNPFEWWHYAYGDRAWAAYMGMDFAVYGGIEER